MSDINAIFIMFLFSLLLLFGVVWSFDRIDKKTENQCIDDCSASNGVFVRSIFSTKSEEQCICKYGTEIKNIW